MSDEILKEWLKGLKVPRAGEQAEGRALHRALAALDQPKNRERSLGWLERGAVALAVLVLLACLPPFLLREREDFSAGEARQLLVQMNALFPGGVNAVISRNEQVDVELESGPSEQPVAIQFRRGRETTQVLSYSGRTVCVKLDGQEKFFEVLVDGDNRIIISGEDFLWDGRTSASLAGFRIEAFSLEPAS